MNGCHSASHCTVGQAGIASGCPPRWFVVPSMILVVPDGERQIAWALIQTTYKERAQTSHTYRSTLCYFWSARDGDLTGVSVNMADSQSSVIRFPQRRVQLPGRVNFLLFLSCFCKFFLFYFFLDWILQWRYKMVFLGISVHMPKPQIIHQDNHLTFSYIVADYFISRRPGSLRDMAWHDKTRRWTGSISENPAPRLSLCIMR